MVERFGHTMCDKLTAGEIPFRKAYIGAIIDRIEVDDHQIRILGRKDVLEQAVMANGGPIPGVRSFVRKWRTRHAPYSPSQPFAFVRPFPCNISVFRLLIARQRSLPFGTNRVFLLG